MTGSYSESPHPFGVPEELSPLTPSSSSPPHHLLHRTSPPERLLTRSNSGLVNLFDEKICTTVNTYVQNTHSLLDDEDLSHQAELVQRLFIMQREFLRNASDTCSVPNVSGSGAWQADVINEIRSPKKSHGSCGAQYEWIQSTISAAGWIIKEPRPVEFIQKQRRAGHKSFKKILDGKRQCPGSIKWVHSWHTVLYNLERFVKEFYPNGLVWEK